VRGTLVARLGRVLRVSTLAFVFSAVAAPAHADHVSKCVASCVGVQAAAGLSVGGGAGTPSKKNGSALVGGRVELAVVDQPRIGLLGGILVEASGRLGVGAEVGVRARLRKGPARFGLAAQSLFAPYTLFGAAVEAGTCWRLRWTEPAALCTDVRGSAQFFGNDLPKGHVVSRLDLVLGVEFDVF
jgi:hypothetical protein